MMALPESQLKEILKTIAKTGHLPTDSEKPLWPEIVDTISLYISHVALTSFEGPNRIIDPLIDASFSVEETIERIQKLLESKFSESPPFTIQRISELLLDPNEIYSKNSLDKWTRALERSLSVVSSVNEYPKITQAEMNYDDSNVLTNGKGSFKEDLGIVMSPVPWVVDEVDQATTISKISL
ncbi:hypothetical protein NADFUDRAFT_63901 [Nadsonia fulvescens var. elongata DSM 6958]|uniref:Uncharacterized protein n=1 Tax=Nadsonia fulvescens var. elongata DSM 6958 TaxID=857566 RepID=A0A1E3PUF5_9ASCO|nr:hypothetical protein NADFUDRAFT_63901 [Nadsonia fulvescens var. elongata DSM 6958]